MNYQTFVNELSGLENTHVREDIIDGVLIVTVTTRRGETFFPIPDPADDVEDIVISSVLLEIERSDLELVFELM